MNYSSVVTAAANGKTADGRNVLELLRLAAQKGDILTIEITGEDEEEAHKALDTVISKEFKGKNAVLSAEYCNWDWGHQCGRLGKQDFK